MASSEDFEAEGRVKRRVIGGLIAIVLIGGAASFFFVDYKPAPRKPKAAEIVNITLPPPPPPPPLPPPPPQPEPPPEPEKQEMIEQEPVVEAEPEPDAPSPEEPPADLGTGITGDGPNGFGLKAGNGNGGGNGRIGGNGRRGGGRFDRQAVGIQNTLLAALKRNDKTRKSEFSGTVSVWADTSGRITRVKLDGSAGSPVVDQAIRDEFTGLQLPDVTGMPMPIHLRLSGRKPSP